MEGLSFDPFSFQQDGVATAEVDVGWRQIADGLLVAVIVVVIDEGIDLGLEVAGEVWPAAGSADTEFGVLMELEADHGTTEIYARV